MRPAPQWLLNFALNRGGKPRDHPIAPLFELGEVPSWIALGATPLADRALDGLEEPVEREDVAAALDILPNPDLGWDAWSSVGMAVFVASGGEVWGLELFDAWCRKSKKWSEGGAAERWGHWGHSPPTRTGFGALVLRVREIESGWVPPSRLPKPAPVEPIAPALDLFGAETINGHHAPPNIGGSPVFKEKQTNPLIKLNEKHSVIGDIGGKCLVMSWVPSKVDETIKVPSFQTFKSFSERYGNQYVTTRREGKDGPIEEAKQLGSYWLKWTGRKSYEGIDLVPNGASPLPGQVLNLWSGFAVLPAAGGWPLMRSHIAGVLADGDPLSAGYIARFAAWAVQHPGERAEVALVFRGGKGSGKGTFANALKRLFGQHGLQIFNSKHLVGSFNGHLRNCLLLFADEAFWAGDKQGESVLKGLITEPALMIEQKGVDAAPWVNRLHVIMAANADWVVPASHDERRYAVIDVGDKRIGDRAYFRALHAELANGGLAAMLHDLLRVELGDWHPRDIVHTDALQRQKERSFDPRWEWWEETLQTGLLPYATKGQPNKIASAVIMEHVRESAPRLRDISAHAIGRFLRDIGCEGLHERNGNSWLFPDLNRARKQMEAKFGKWHWRVEMPAWRTRE